MVKNNLGLIILIGTDELWVIPENQKNGVINISMISRYIAQGMLGMTDDDLWIITADHGNDPTKQNIPTTPMKWFHCSFTVQK